jgi:pyruvate dehydrogenase E2 component (dihydrolipoamide acetyltransferase)
LTLPLEFRLADIGEGIADGEIVEWCVAVGDRVREDDPLVEIETDKAITVIPCPTTGTVLELRGAPGDTVPVGGVLALFDPAEDQRPAAPEPDGRPAAAQPASRPLAAPAVRKLSRDLGVDLSDVVGSGPGGRILREDVDAAQAGARSSAPPTTEVPPAGRDEVVPLRGTRRAIAQTLTRSWQTIPHVIDYREVDATALVAARKGLKERAIRTGPETLAGAMTVTPLIVKMVAATLARHPYANASIDLERGEITLHGSLNIGVATAAPAGLVVPVVHGADGKSVTAIALEIAELAQAARAGRLTTQQLAGGTVTVNNYGSLGVWLGTPIILPGQIVNFGIGKLEDRAVVRDGEVVVRPIIPLAVSADHRVLDGHTLAAFVGDVVDLMEQPSLLLADLR